MAPLGDSLHVALYTERGDVTRIISLRKTDQWAFDDYECSRSQRKSATAN
jgi:uncharacterized DUF497 family protein